MAIKTYAEQLESVQKAIEEVELYGQSHSIKDRTFTKADLNALYRREERLRPLAQREEAGGGISISYGYANW